MTPVLRFEGVSARYRGGPEILRDVNVALGPGLHVLLAPNGAGKTTFFRLAAGILRPTRGSVSICGQSPSDCPAIKRRIGYVTHRIGLYPQLSLRQNLRFWGQAAGMPAERADERIDALAETFRLTSLLDVRHHALSRGQAQKGALVRALLAEPRLLLLDEPASGLDLETSLTLIDHIRARARAGATVVYSTHRIEDNQTLADATLYIQDGRVELEEYGQEQARRKLFLRCAGDPRPLLSSLSLSFRRFGEGWLIGVADEERLPGLTQLLRELPGKPVLSGASEREFAL
jgi:ABC-type multidrug transport system ATPase subunit